MADESVVIKVTDEVSEGPARKILAIANNARDAHTNLNKLSMELRSISTSSVRKLQEELTKQTVEVSRQARALESLSAAQARTEAAQARATRQQALATSATAAIAVQTQRLATEQERTAAASERATLARERAVNVSNRNTAAMDKEGDAATRLYRQVDQLQKLNRASQTSAGYFEAFTSQPSNKSARQSASVFAQDARDKAEAAKATENLTQRANALRAAIDPLYAAQSRFDREMVEALALRRAGAISEQTYAQAVAMSTQAMNVATGASKRMTDQTKLNRFQVLTLQYTINDVIASLASGASPFTILAQQGGQVTQAWGGVGNTFRALGGALATPVGMVTAVVGAIAAMLLVVDRANSEFKGFQRTLDATTGSAGLTAGSYAMLSERIATASNVSIASARETAMEYSKTGQLQRREIEQLSIVTENFAKLTGDSSDKVVKSLSKIADEPAKVAGEFVMRYNSITAAQYAYIKSLEDAGKKTEATTALSKMLYDYYGNEAPRNLSAAASAWNSLGRAISDAYTKAKQALLYEKSAEQELADARILSAQLERNMKTVDPSLRAEMRMRLDAANAQIAAGERQVKVNERNATVTAEYAKTQREGKVALDELSNYSAEIADNSDKAQKSIAKFRMQLEKAGKATPNDPAYINALANQAKIEKGLRDKAMPDAKTDGKKAEALAESRALSMERVNGELSKELNSYGMLGPARDAQRKFDEIEIQLKAKKITLSQTERDAIMKSITVIEEAKRSQQAMNASYDAAVGPLRNYMNALEATNALHQQGLITGQEMLRQQRMAKEAYETTVDPLRAINRTLDEEARLRGKVGKERELEIAMIQAEAALRGRGETADSKASELEAVRQRTKASIDQKAIDTELNSLYDKAAGKLETLKARQVALNQAYERGYIGLTAYGESLRELEAEAFAAKETMGVDTFGDRVAESFNRNIGSMEDKLTSFLTTGKLDFNGFIDSVLADLARMEVRKNITGPLSAAGGISGLLGWRTPGTASASGAFVPDAGMASYANEYASLIGIPKYDVGTPYVPQDQIAMVHEGERILTARENKTYNAGNKQVVHFNPVTYVDSKTDQGQIAKIVARANRASSAELVNRMQIAGM